VYSGAGVAKSWGGNALARSWSLSPRREGAHHNFDSFAHLIFLGSKVEELQQAPRSAARHSARDILRRGYP